MNPRRVVRAPVMDRPIAVNAERQFHRGRGDWSAEDRQRQYDRSKPDMSHPNITHLDTSHSSTTGYPHISTAPVRALRAGGVCR
jgi:hypothetical protein